MDGGEGEGWFSGECWYGGVERNIVFFVICRVGFL